MMIRSGSMPSPEEAKLILERELGHEPTAAIGIMSEPTFLLVSMMPVLVEAIIPTTIVIGMLTHRWLTKPVGNGPR